MSREASSGPLARRAPPGVFVAVVGPSGAGKDTLMAMAARHAELNPRVRFIRRIVTRDAVAASEDHDSLDRETFARAEAEGVFSLTWAAHGLLYALPRAVVTDLEDGQVAVANLSRRVLGAAEDLFGRLHVVEVTARRDLLLDRLAARGRESLEQIQERLDRQMIPVKAPRTGGHVVIDNSGEVDVATDRFVGHLNALCERP